jgi:hypothetical protein
MRIYAYFQQPEGEIMKKKVALLLVLSMILSMLPMNVFGAIIVPGHVLNPAEEPRWEVRTLEVSVNMEQLTTTTGQQQRARLEFILQGHDTNERPVRFASVAAVAGASDPGNGAFELNDTLPWMRPAVPMIRVSDLSQLSWVPSPGATPITITGAEARAAFNQVDVDSNGVVTGIRGLAGELDVASLRVDDGRHILDAWLAFTSGVAVDSAGNVIPNQVLPHITGLSGTLVLEIGNSITNNGAGANGVLSYNGGATLTVNRQGRFPGDVVVPLVRNQLVTFASTLWGVDITAASVRDFESGLILPEIRVTERRPGSLNGASFSGDFTPGAAAATHVIRLIGPRDYVWNIGVPGHLANVPAFSVSAENPNIFNVTNNLTASLAQTLPDGSIRNHGGQVISQSFTDDGRPVIDIRVDVSARGPFPSSELRGRLNINGLLLAPVRDIHTTGDVKIDVEVGRLGFVGGTAGAAQLWTPNFNQNFREAGLPGFITAGAQVEAVVTNIMNLNRTGAVWPSETALVNAINAAPGVSGVTAAMINPNIITTWFSQGGGGGTAGTEGFIHGGAVRGNWRQLDLLVGNRRTSTLRMGVSGNLPELISGRREPNGARSSIGFPDLTQHGGNNNTGGRHRTAMVQIEELVPGAFDTGFLNSIVDFQLSEGVKLIHASWRINSNVAAANVPWAGHHVNTSTNHPAVGTFGVPSMTEDSLRIFVPRNVNATARRTLEVFFYVSVEAGYAWKYDEPISVTVSGNAVSALPAAERSADIATVRDPITVSLDGSPILAEIGQVMNLLEPTEIPDIIIQETAVGALTRGTQFTLTLDALPISVLGNHAVVGSTFVVEGNSGMELRVTNLGGTGNSNASVLFEVTRESLGEPATIRLTNNHIMGTILPGVRYVVSINGGRLPVPANINETTNTFTRNTARTADTRPDQAAGLGVFDSIPYYVEVVEFSNFDLDGVAPPGDAPVLPGEGPGTAHLTPQLVLGAGAIFSPSLGAMVQQPSITVGGATLVALRPFMDFLPATHTWDAHNRRVILEGRHNVSGANVQVVLNIGSPVAFVNGQQVDIATFVNDNTQSGVSFPSGAAGTVTPILHSDLTYLPARFLAYAFGLTTDWANGVTTISR